jgi:hypothetical protein
LRALVYNITLKPKRLIIGTKIVPGLEASIRAGIDSVGTIAQSQDNEGRRLHGWKAAHVSSAKRAYQFVIVSHNGMVKIDASIDVLPFTLVVFHIRPSF